MTTIAPAPTKRVRHSSGLRRSASPIALLALWQVASTTGVLPADKLSPPSDVVRALVDLWQAGTLQDAIGTSVQRVLVGFTIGAAVGVTLALVAGLTRLGEDAVDPPMQMLRTLPHFGLLPLFILWFGIDETPKIALIALGVAFPLYVNTFAGIRGVDPKLVEAGRALGLSWSERIRHVILPGALPSALVGLRLSLGVAWLTLIVAEQINTTAGIGYLVSDAASFSRTDEVVGGLLVYSVLGLLTDSLVRLIERKALAWRIG
ncbi:ABC transporter permease [Aeromicrobium yanjiei]|uniref:ABC transporter permease subunit n=1 Tax=Aeromicrobium yanjiei TaxID=2662028 RepID=A0A5Q2MH88_9ACTN|nr:ABC transporter permease [Aeromicrobium yanjiei]QGG40412.1 ABC transporter permease subunit [Aeromicrobium yanjiei]